MTKKREFLSKIFQIWKEYATLEFPIEATLKIEVDKILGNRTYIRVKIEEKHEVKFSSKSTEEILEILQFLTEEYICNVSLNNTKEIFQKFRQML